MCTSPVHFPCALPTFSLCPCQRPPPSPIIHQSTFVFCRTLRFRPLCDEESIATSCLQRHPSLSTPLSPTPSQDTSCHHYSPLRLSVRVSVPVSISSAGRSAIDCDRWLPFVELFASLRSSTRVAAKPLFSTNLLFPSPTSRFKTRVNFYNYSTSASPSTKASRSIT